MARVQIVSSGRLTSKSLRAQDYILSPSHLAKRLVDDWAEEECLDRLLRKDAPARRSLVKRAEDVIRGAIEQAQACLLDLDHID